MRKMLGFTVLLVLMFGICVQQRPLEAKDKDDLVQLKDALVVLQSKVRDLQESSDKNSSQVSTLLNQVVDGISVTRRDVSQTRDVVDRSLSDVNTATNNVSQQLLQLNDRLNATDARVERLEVSIKELKNIFEPVTKALSGDCDKGEDQYKVAYADYITGKYPLAIDEFRNYVNCFAGTEKAGSAQFLIGDGYYKLTDYKSALLEFEKVIKDYPTNSRIATARFKKADCLLKTDQRKLAEDEFKLLMQLNPNSPEAKQAEQVLRDLPPLPQPTPQPTPKPTRPRRN